MTRLKTLQFLLLFLLGNSFLARSQTDSVPIISAPGRSDFNVRLFNAQAINTEHLEFSPTYYENGIVYTTSRMKSGGIDESIGENYFQLFYAELGPNGMPLNPRPFSAEINSHLHEGPVDFNYNGSTMYFTRNNLSKRVKKADKDGVVRLKIYEAHKGLSDWERIEELPFNSATYSCAHPALSADGRRLIFASDMPGGYGGMDLYMVEKKGDMWSHPQNLGKKINTWGNEVFPYWHHSGMLFFASDGRGGMGGLDLYSVKLDAKDPVAVPLGEPFNSSADDLGLILNDKGNEGFFASSRGGGRGKDDIFYFQVDEGLWGLAKREFAATILVTDLTDGRPIQGATIRIFEESTSGYVRDDQLLYKTVLVPSGDDPDKLIFQLIRNRDVLEDNPDLVTDEHGLAATTFQGQQQYLILASKDDYRESEMLISTFGGLRDSFIHIQLERSACVELQGVVLNQYNQKPLPNAVIKITNSCNKEEEVLLTDGDGRFNYCMPHGCDYIVNPVKEGFEGAPEWVKSNQIAGRETYPLTLYMEPLKQTLEETSLIAEGSVIVLENIYYDFNKSEIRAGAAIELDHVANLMKKYPSMEIELISHTDSRGTRKYNQKLSDRRSDSAKEYLVARGVQSYRIRTKGMGETQLRNNCTDGVTCSESDHQYNRRTDIRVIRIEEEVRFEYTD